MMLFFYLSLFATTVVAQNIKDAMNCAHIRFQMPEGHYKIFHRSSDCHNCTFDIFDESFDDGLTDYKKIDMQFTQDFCVVKVEDESIDDCDAFITTARFQEYGVYTLNYTSSEIPMQITVDEAGHNYYVPLFFMIAITIALWCLIVMIENIRKYRDTFSDDKDPLLSSNNPRIVSIDVFRGIAICVMIFANYGAGSYKRALEHATWDGITLSDFAFPLFMFTQGMSLPLSMNGTFKRYRTAGYTPIKATWMCVLKCLKRAVILYVLNALINRTQSFETMRILGVLAYFSVSGLVNSLVVLFTPVWLQDHGIISRWKARAEYSGSPSVHHIFDWIVPTLFAAAHWIIAKHGAAPGCPVGYTGPGGKADHGIYSGCTGGIYRYIDLKLLGEEHMYHGSAVVHVYGGNHFECEGIMGMMNAIFLTYLGTIVFWVLRTLKKPKAKVATLFGIGVALLLFGGILCGFKQYDGYMPINKNKWNTSFIIVTAGTGFCIFAITYLLVDVLKVWSGYPIRAMGMNSILIFVIHEFVGSYLPFSYGFDNASHWTTMINSYVLGVGMWIIIGNEFYRQNVLFKVCIVSLR